MNPHPPVNSLEHLCQELENLNHLREESAWGSFTMDWRIQRLEEEVAFLKAEAALALHGPN